MKLRPVLKITPRPFHPLPLAAKIAKYNEAATRHDRNLEKRQSRAASAEVVDLATFNFDNCDPLMERASETLLAQDELSLRRQFAELDEVCNVELGREVTAAWQRKEAIYEEIVERLKSIGYIDPLDRASGQILPGSWFNGMVRNHREHIAAEREHLDLQAEAASRDRGNENEGRIDELERQLAARRRAGLGIPEPPPAFMQEVRFGGKAGEVNPETVPSWRGECRRS